MIKIWTRKSKQNIQYLLSLVRNGGNQTNNLPVPWHYPSWPEPRRPVGGQQPQKINDGEEDDETNVDLCPALGQAPFRAAAVWWTNTPVWGLTLGRCPLSCNVILIWNSCEVFTVSFPGNTGCHFGERWPDSDLWCLSFSVEAESMPMETIRPQRRYVPKMGRGDNHNHCFWCPIVGLGGWTSRAQPSLKLKYSWA